MATSDDDFRPHYLGAEENLADLVSRIDPAHQELYRALRHIYTEAAFFDRRFVVVKTTGKSSNRPRPPQILGEVVVTAFRASHEAGCVATLKDEGSGRLLQVGYVPVKLFDFPVFASIPIYQGVKWEAREMQDGSYRRNLVFGLCFKQKSAVKFYNKDEVAVVTRNDFRKHFGDTLPRF